MLAQTAGRDDRELLPGRVVGEGPEVGGLEPVEPESRSTPTVDESAEAFRFRDVDTRADDGEHLVRPETSQSEGDRGDGRRIRPMDVVDEHDHGRAVLQLAEEAEQRRPRARRAPDRRVTPDDGCELSRQRVVEPGHEALEDPEGESALRLVAGCLQHAGVRAPSEEATDQRGLPDAGWTLDQDDSRRSCPSEPQLRVKRGEFSSPPEERAGHLTLLAGAKSAEVRPDRGTGRSLGSSTLLPRRRQRRGDAKRPGNRTRAAARRPPPSSSLPEAGRTT